MVAEEFHGDVHGFAAPHRDVTALPDLPQVAKCLLAGADVAPSASASLRHGPDYAGVLLQDLQNWMNCKGFQSLDEVHGPPAVPGAEGWAAPERADCVWAVREANSGAYSGY